MKVILLDELKGRGGEGDVIDVATGYAVNFLFPKKLAIAATKGNLKQLEQRKHNIAKREASRLDTADKLVAALEGQTIRIGAKVGEEGQLFGSVTPIQVADAINTKFNTEIDRRRIDLHGIIKTVGEHAATISIYRELKVSLTVEVVDEKTLLANAQNKDAEDEPAVTEGIEDQNAETEAEESPEILPETLADIETALEDAAATIAEAAEAAENDSTDAAAIAEAAVEVLQDVEGAIDAAIADAVVAEVEAEIANAIEAEAEVEAEAEAEVVVDTDVEAEADTDVEAEG
jgi:large subunit ribosomal protein L9